MLMPHKWCRSEPRSHRRASSFERSLLCQGDVAVQVDRRECGQPSTTATWNVNTFRRSLARPSRRPPGGRLAARDHIGCRRQHRQVFDNCCTTPATATIQRAAYIISPPAIGSETTRRRVFPAG